MTCPNCGAEVRGKFCEYCGSEMPRTETVTNINNSSKKIINNYYNYIPKKTVDNGSKTKNQKQTDRKNNGSHHKSVFTIIWLIFFFPVGLIMMWVKKDFTKAVRIIITAFFVLVTICSMVSPETNTTTDTTNAYKFSPTPVATIVPTQEPKNSETMQDAFEEGFKDGLGDSAADRKEDIDESIESIKEAINYIFSE